MNEKGGTLFRKLGLGRVVNAYETVALYGGSVMRPGVVEAMAEAAGWSVSVPDLNHRAGERLAALTRNEAAFVTAGCAAALALSLAACMAGKNRDLAGRLPETEGMKDEVVLFRCQRNPYDRALLLTGAKIVEAGRPDRKAEPADLEGALTDRTAAIFYFAGSLFERLALPLETVAVIAKDRGVPVVVDAAALVPPKENLWRFAERGADLVLFSGGKGIRGPQDSGLVLGRRNLVEAVEALASPYQSFGRPMKTSKEAVVGLLRAVELLLEEDYDVLYEVMTAKLTELVDLFKGDAAFEKVYLLPTGRLGQRYPRAVFSIQKHGGVSRERFLERLLEGDPAVLAGPLDEDDHSFYVNPFGFQGDEEYEIVAAKIREAILHFSLPV